MSLGSLTCQRCRRIRKTSYNKRGKNVPLFKKKRGHKISPKNREANKKTRMTWCGLYTDWSVNEI